MTDVSLETYMERRFVDLEKYIEARFVAVEEAVGKAESSLSLRLEGMNEVRDQLREQAARFITRDAHEALQTRIAADIEALKLNSAELRGKASMQAVIVAYLVSAAGLALAIVALWLRE